MARWQEIVLYRTRLERFDYTIVIGSGLSIDKIKYELYKEKLLFILDYIYRITTKGLTKVFFVRWTRLSVLPFPSIRMAP